MYKISDLLKRMTKFSVTERFFFLNHFKSVYKLMVLKNFLTDIVSNLDFFDNMTGHTF
jgi:hypothetical protein